MMIRVGTDCSGIEAPIQALRQLGWKHHHLFSSDIDKACRDVITTHYRPDKVYTDMTQRCHSDLPHLDLYVAGFPCQPFSALRDDAKGFQDPRGTIFFECLETIRHTQPKCFLLENVRGLTTHDHGRTFETILHELADLGNYRIHHKILNTKHYGLPHNRPRVYIVGIRHDFPDFEFQFPEPIPLECTVRSLMDRDLPPDIVGVTPNMRAVIRARVAKKHGSMADNYIVNVGASENGFGSAMKDVSPCLMANAPKFYSTLFQRFLTGREYLRLQGFPDSFPGHPNERITKKQAGNTMSVNVLVVLLRQLQPILYPPIKRRGMKTKQFTIS